MIRKLFNLSLIVALLGSQALACCAHVHEDVATNQKTRAHIHLGGHPHCHNCQHGNHSNEHCPESDHDHHPDGDDHVGVNPFDSLEHDSDAVYLTDEQTLLLVNGKQVKKSACSVTVPDLEVYGHPLSSICRITQSESEPASTRALYLKTSRLLL